MGVMSITKSVFITGAAAGIGRATALSFARNGYVVGAYDIDQVGLKTLRDEIEDLGATAVTGHLDVTDADEMAQRVAEFVAAANGRLDVMINNAGILIAGRFDDIAVTAHHREIDVKTGTTDSLGIRLTAQDIADDIVKAVDPSWPRRLIHQVHFPVGSQAKTMAVGARFSPAWLTRLVNKRLAHS